MSSGTVDKVKGRLEEAAGALLGDEKLKREAAETVVDEAKRLVKDR